MITQTKKNLIIALLLFVLALGVLIFMLLQINQQSAELHKQVNLLAEHQAQRDTFFQLRKTAEESEADRVGLEVFYFKDRNDGVDFLTTIEETARQFGVVLQTQSVTEKIDTLDNSEWFVMDFEIAGNQQQVLDFIAYTEVLPYALRINGLQMTEKEGASGQWAGTLFLQVRVLAYDS